MKNQNALKFLSFLLFPILMILGIFSLPISKANAKISANENFTSVEVGDENFKMQMFATGRKNSKTLEKKEKTVTVNLEDEQLTYTYNCFDWRDLEYLTFKFSVDNKLSQSQTVYKSIEFKVTNIQTENLETPFGTGNEKNLYRSDISLNSFPEFNFYYYIDSTSEKNESTIRRKGNDFGIYKFDFSYTKEDEGKDVKVSVGEIYVAVIPDDIDSIQHSDMKILYTISSSNKLMNIFNLYLSKDNYKYVNPKYLEWIVTGNDKSNVSYVYSQKIKDENSAYINHKTIWQVPPKDNHGVNFIFDSNDIEGTWEATYIIKNKNGEEKAKVFVQDLSTIKLAKKSYVWLILLVIGLAVLLGGMIALIVFYVKCDKVW